MIRYSSYIYVALLNSLLANVSVHRSRERGTIAAVVARVHSVLSIDACFLC